MHSGEGFLFTVVVFCSGFAVFEKSNPSETPVDKQKSETPFVLQARASAGLGFLRTNKMNHAMKNNSQKILSISHEVKTPLDSNKENISAKFQLPLTGSTPMKKTFALRAIFAVVLVFGFAFNSSAAPAETYVYGN